jgi:drug/metabolite transporter (DMT)-like permease
MAILILVYNFCVCLLSAYVCTKIKNGELPGYATFISSTLLTLGWFYCVNYAKESLLQMNALVEVSASVGFYIGLYLMGVHIKPLQLLGILLMILGLYLVNKH